MKIEINVSNKAAYTIIALVIVSVVFVGVYAYTYQTELNPGHGGDRVLIYINGQEKDLQTAIDDGSFITTEEVEQKITELKIACTWTGWFYGGSKNRWKKSYFDTGDWEKGKFTNIYCEDGFVTKVAKRSFWTS